MFTLLDPPPAVADLPDRFPSPFAVPPHPLAQRAAAVLRREMEEWRGDADGGGKMFGVLVAARPDGRIGFLRAFSGMLDRRWHAPGFVPPLFEVAARDAFWPAGEAALGTLSARITALEAAAAPTRATLAALAQRHAADETALQSSHRTRRAVRRSRRATTSLAADEQHALAQESRADAAALRRLREGHTAACAPLVDRLAAVAAERAALEAERAERSRGYWERLHDTYHIANAHGAVRRLRELFAPAAPPAGAGDCAAPKLIGYAYHEGLRPIALAEFWWGPPPPTGGRHAGRYYPACRGKCRPILAHMLDGLAADPAPEFGTDEIPSSEPRVVFEDAWIVVVDKPVGLLSVPGRSGALRDSVLTRLRARYPDATGPLVVHRLDLDTSGLLLAAKDERTHAALQRQFAQGEVTKRYVAWLDGLVGTGGGTVALALRVDVDDRPRQLHDPVHGKPALTEWRVVARTADRTRVALHPRTGRTHQLRVHAAHPLGIGVPIVGDRLYGRAGDTGRLLLDAEGLVFRHPHTGEQMTLERPAPF